MKLILAFLILVVIPIVLSAVLLVILVPMAYQHFFKSKQNSKNRLYPNYTSWEES